MALAVFWVVAPCRLVKVYIVILIMEAAWTCEMLVNLYKFTWCYNPEDGRFHVYFFLTFLLCRNVRKDFNMQVSLGLEWFCTADVLSHKIHSTQSYILMPYQPYAFVMWHFLFASLSWPKITYPSLGYEVRLSSERYTLNVSWLKVFCIYNVLDRLFLFKIHEVGI
jgi:hypothetical protein